MDNKTKKLKLKFFLLKIYIYNITLKGHTQMLQPRDFGYEF
jgi:hypothetical protein